jgi:radical SAM superfamily enzyme YgiQ (UPF0313 family)
VRALLVSTYDLGRQPFGLASPAAWLRAEGVEVRCVDLAKEPLPLHEVDRADLIAFHLPMHTATRLAGPVIAKVRARRRDATLCAYGLYAPLNSEWLRSLGVNHLLGGEFEGDLTAIARALKGADDRTPPPVVSPPDRRSVPRLMFRVPDRSSLPPLTKYATLRLADGSTRRVGSTEASRGCRHLCRHCPVVPVYRGQFRVVPNDVVMADVAVQVEQGAEHITFGDPDFLNGPTHAMRVVRALHERFPSLTYDVTVKIEHLLQHRSLLPVLGDTGCLFVTSAVESLDDRVLARLEKGHTRCDFVEVVQHCRDAGLTLVPTFVAFHPWLTLDDYCELLDTIAALGLVDHVAPIQLALRLLIPPGSRLLELDEVRDLVGPFDPGTLTYRWQHPDSRVDELHEDVIAFVGTRMQTDRRAVFSEIRSVAYERAGRSAPPPLPASSAVEVPYLSEPWYCCAEPSADLVRLV